VFFKKTDLFVVYATTITMTFWRRQ